MNKVRGVGRQRRTMRPLLKAAILALLLPRTLRRLHSAGATLNPFARGLGRTAPSASDIAHYVMRSTRLRGKLQRTKTSTLYFH